MKSRDMQIAEAVRDACKGCECADGEHFIDGLDLHTIIASVPKPEPAGHWCDLPRMIPRVVWREDFVGIKDGDPVYAEPPAAEINRQLLDAAMEFCARVEAGEVRSKYTYSKFKEAIAAAEKDICK